jgi:membrane-associated phospholipid phosphatase
MSTSPAQPRAGRAPLIIAAVALVVFASLGAVAWQRPLPDWDHRIVRNALSWGDRGDLALRVVMQFGTTSVAIVLAVLVLVLRRSLRAALTVVAGAFVGSWTATLVKHIWGRPRPSVAFSDIVPRLFVPGYGFPSSHATIAAALAITLGAASRRQWWPLLGALAVGTAVARVAFGVHFVLDVSAGLALGTAVGALAVWVSDRSVGWRREPVADRADWP